MVFQTFLEQVAINGLRRSRAISRRDNYLAIGRRDASGGIQPVHGSFHAGIDFDLALRIQFRAERFAEFVMNDIAARGEQDIDRDAPIIFKAD